MTSSVEGNRKLEQNDGDALSLRSFAVQIIVEEFKNLRGEIEQSLKNVRNLEIYEIIGTSIYYSWLLTHRSVLPDITVFGGQIVVSKILAFIPLGAALLATLRIYDDQKAILKSANYLVDLERKLADFSIHNGIDIGWETYCRRDRLKMDDERALVSKGELAPDDILSGVLISGRNNVSSQILQRRETVATEWKCLCPLKQTIKIGTFSFVAQSILILVLLIVDIFLSLSEDRPMSLPACPPHNKECPMEV